MSFFGRENKNEDGFHAVVEVLDDAIIFSVLVVKGQSYGELAKIKMAHRISLENGLFSSEINKIGAVLTKGLVALAEESQKKLGQKNKKQNKIKIESATIILFPPWFTKDIKENIQIGKPGQAKFISRKIVEEALVFANEKMVMELFVDSIKLNGYEIVRPFGKKTKEAAVSGHFYTAEKNLLDCLKKIISFHTEKEPSIITFPRTCAVFAYRHSLKLPVFFISVENETTSVCAVYQRPPESLFHSNLPAYTSETVDYGLNQIIKAVMDKSGAEKEAALSYMRLLGEDMLEAKTSLLIKSACEEALQNWKAKVFSILPQIVPTWAGSKNIILCRNPQFNGLFIQTLSRHFEGKVSIEQMVFEASLFSV